MKTEITTIDIKQLQFNEGQIDGVPSNPRIIKDDNYKRLLKSIQENPEFMHINTLKVYQQGKKYVVIGGNMRLKAVKELKWTEVPCIVIPKNTSAEKLKKYVLLDNASYGESDWEKLMNEWQDMDLADFGIEIPEFEVGGV